MYAEALLELEETRRSNPEQAHEGLRRHFEPLARLAQEAVERIALRGEIKRQLERMKNDPAE
jgi:hypothetical protein